MTGQKTYRLPGSSISGNAGFEMFKAKDDGLYYFHFNDAKGQAVLFSKSYATARTRTARCNTLRKRMSIRSSYVKKAVNGSYYIAVLGENREELARSKAFETQKSRDLLFEKLQKGDTANGAAKRVDLSPKKPGKPTRKKEEQDPEPPKDKNAQQARYRFNITFRKAADKTPLSGEIQFPISEEKSSFQGFDLDTIRQFITQHLPDDTSAFSKDHQKEIDAIKTEWRQAIQTGQEKAAKQAEELNQKLKAADKRETEQQREFEADTKALKKQFQSRISDLEKSLKAAQGRIKALEKEIEELSLPPKKEEPVTANPAVPNQPPPALRQLLAQEQSKLSKPIVLMVGGKITENLNLHKTNLPIEFLLKIDEPEEQEAFESYRAIFQIKSMENGQIHWAVQFNGDLGQRNQILLSGNSLSSCAPGLYKLILRVFPLDPSAPDCEIEGKRVVFVL